MSSTRREYTSDDHWAAAAALLTCSSETSAARNCGIPLMTMRGWIKQEWFQEILSKIKQEHERAYLASCHALITAGTKKALKALEEGEVVIDKNGAERRRPVSAKDAAVIASIFINHKRVMENKPTSISATSGNMKKLEEQKAMFEKMASASGASSETDSSSTKDIPNANVTVPSPEWVPGRETAPEHSPDLAGSDSPRS